MTERQKRPADSIPFGVKNPTPEDLYRYACKVSLDAHKRARFSPIHQPRQWTEERHKTSVVTGIAAVKLALEGDFPVPQRDLLAVAKCVLVSGKSVPEEMKQGIQKEFMQIRPQNEHVKQILVRLMAQQNRKQNIERFSQNSAAAGAISRPEGDAGFWWDFSAEVLDEAGYYATDAVINSAINNPGGFWKATTSVCDAFSAIDLSGVRLPSIDLPDCDAPKLDCDLDCPCSD